MITDEELARLEALAAAATPGPWAEEATDDRYHGRIYALVASGSYVGCVSCNEEGCTPMGDNDAAFIAAAREAVPALIAEVRRLREVSAKEREVGATLERQAVVAWLRAQSDDPPCAAQDDGLTWVAAAIEREEHLK